MSNGLMSELMAALAARQNSRRREVAALFADPENELALRRTRAIEALREQQRNAREGDARSVFPEISGPAKQQDAEQGLQLGLDWMGGGLGMLSRADIASVLKQARKKGGATQPLSGAPQPKSGYAVSTTNRGKQTVFDPRAVRTGDIEKFIRQQEMKDDKSLGLWLNPEDKKLYVDRSEVFPSRFRAVQEAKANKQLAVWDLKRKKEIDTRPKPPEAPPEPAAPPDFYEDDVMLGGPRPKPFAQEAHENMRAQNEIAARGMPELRPLYRENDDLAILSHLAEYGPKPPLPNSAGKGLLYPEDPAVDVRIVMEGRKGVTPHDVDHEVARLRATLPKEEGGLDLPLGNTSMDRAKAMGYTTPAYRGSNSPEITGGKSTMGPGTWWTQDPHYAGAYTVDPDSVSHIVRKNPGEGELAPNVMPLLVKMDEKAKPLDEVFRHYANEDALKKWGTLFSKHGDSISQAVSHPANVRSRFAAFDPFKKDSKDLLAGLIAAGILPVGLLAGVDEDQ